MDWVTEIRPPEGTDPVFHLELYRDFVRFRLIKTSACEVRVPLKAIERRPDWQRESIPELVGIQAERCGLEVAAEYEDPLRKLLVMTLVEPMGVV